MHGNAAGATDAIASHEGCLGTTGAERYVRRVNVEMAHLTRVMKAT
jgi:hypothetical protein